MPDSHLSQHIRRLSLEPDAYGVERRVHRRLALRLPVALRRAEETDAVVVHSRTRDISAGGLYFEMADNPFRAGDRLRVDLSLPASMGVSTTPGRAHGTARVLRVTPLTSDQTGVGRYGIAAAFTDRLRFDY